VTSFTGVIPIGSRSVHALLYVATVTSSYDPLMPGEATVVSVNVGAVREFDFHGQPRTTAIYKEPVTGRVRVRRLGIDGDRQADLSVHGGASKAVYAYAAEDNAWWAEQLGIPMPPGTLGENLTVAGLDLNDLRLAERITVGSATLEVTQPRFPCWKLGMRMGSQKFTKRFLAAERPGTYFSVVEEGSVGVGDPVRRVSPPGHQLTVGVIAHLNDVNRQLALKILDAAEAGTPPELLTGLLNTSVS
jgi:MOSC domain-containing protein YiiM